MNNYTHLLNRQVANFGVLYTKLHNFHWFVKGFQFFQLHELFERLYDEVTEHFDAVAERLLMLDLKPYASLKDFLANTSLQEATGKEELLDMVKSTIADFEVVNKELAELIKGAQDAADEVTVDLALGIQSSIQKHLWMLKSTVK
ncbi:MAG: Dps family protein [Candidatus Izemoplasmatales bacterium]|jgi:starvation-inducible DNA-binding protein|nr:Dps family protein [bacterium]MDZ4195697.1 Dps family protein [Candidatus Izemoplasmatales bacterium]